MKFELAVLLDSSTIEPDCLFTITPHPQKTRNYGLKALLCMHIVFPYTTREPEIKWAELFKMNIKIKQGSNFVLDNERCFFDA